MVRLVEITFRRVILLSFNVKSVESEAIRKFLRTLHPMELDDHLLDVPLHVPKLYDRASPCETFHRSLHFSQIYLELSNGIHSQLVTADK